MKQSTVSIPICPQPVHTTGLLTHEQVTTIQKLYGNIGPVRELIEAYRVAYYRLLTAEAQIEAGDAPGESAV